MEQARGISTLPLEILSEIFTLNAVTLSENCALTDTWSTAQVCQLWRNLLLQRPYLWGQLIDLDVLCHERAKEDWRNEVLRRCQGALLWIYGDVELDPMPSWTFFTYLLSNHWSRIQRLYVELDFVDAHDPTWEAMLKPAPNLEVFQVSFEGRQLFSRDAALFSGNASCLREFLAPKIAFSLCAPWLSNLRSIALSFPITVRETLQALKQMPVLERLRLDKLFSIAYETSLPHVALPNLTELVIRDFLEAATPVLAHITPAPGCSLSMEALDYSDVSLTTQILSDIHSLLLEYLKNFYHTQTRTATHIALRFQSRVFRFEDQTNPFGQPFFIVLLKFGPKTMVGNERTEKLAVLTKLLSAFTSTPTLFPLARKLDLEVAASPTFESIYASLLSPSTFPAIEVLEISVPSLRALQVWPPGNRHGHTATATLSQPDSFPFPSLKTLKISQLPVPGSTFAPHILFLLSRRRGGFPVQVLELDLAQVSASVEDIKLFGSVLDEEAVGMTVRVPRKITGNGTAEEDSEEVRVFDAVCGEGRVTQLFSRWLDV